MYCCYCNFDFATDRDHVIPKSYSDNYSFANTVPACRDCNALLSNTPNHNIEDRTSYLYTAYYKKYKKLLDGPVWSKKEISKLKGQLRSHVMKQEAKRLEIQSKLDNIKITAKRHLFA
jgi:hypothetical protein